MAGAAEVEEGKGERVTAATGAAGEDEDHGGSGPVESTTSAPQPITARRAGCSRRLVFLAQQESPRFRAVLPSTEQVLVMLLR
jgi:hypothetical protein